MDKIKSITLMCIIILLSVNFIGCTNPTTNVPDYSSINASSYVTNSVEYPEEITGSCLSIFKVIYTLGDFSNKVDQIKIENSSHESEDYFCVNFTIKCKSTIKNPLWTGIPNATVYLVSGIANETSYKKYTVKAVEI